MPRLTVSISEDQQSFIEEKAGDGRPYESKSAFVRECLQRYEQVDELEAQVNDLQNQLRAANSKNDDMDDLAEYVQGERELQSMERERRNAPIWDRVRWLIFGRE